ncbi:MAG TPA: cytochrome c oxidase subunit II, partial [Gemmatimonadaceae bacterium]|nr:cytochrome c oxidase subunit II [Gemmatimonadaceae bacterium]
MSLKFRPRRLVFAALTVALVAFTAACGSHPDSVFHSRTEFNREVDGLFKLIIWLGTFVFLFVEGVLVYTLWRFRARPGQREPQHVHGNTTLEILWTAIPAVILVIIAIPTVRTIFRTQAKARADALQVEVIGHQWWWEFRYPQYGVITANELYLPIGRTVNFTLKTQDVLHSFWIPALGGKRDLIANHTNYLWFTPDSSGVDAFNGFCAEYCGTSHANMRFRTYTVTPAQFESWAQHQAAPAVGATAMPGVVGNTQAAVAQNPSLAQPVAPTPSQVKPNINTGAAGQV